MILGWLKRRRMEREELAELRDFTAEMESVLENVDMLLSIMDQDSEVAICTEAFWRPEYHFHDWNRGPFQVAQPVPMPQPQASWDAFIDRPYQRVSHQAIRLRCDTLISEHEIRLRRTPAEMASLVARVGDEIKQKLQDHIMRAATDPESRLKMLNVK